MTDTSSIEQRAHKIISEHLGVERERVTANARFIEDLGADSFDTVELVMAFEEEFNLDIADDVAEAITTVGGAVAYVTKNVQE